MYSFCTYFDQHYLSRGLALYHSLQKHCPAFQLWVLCMDNTSHQILSRLNLPHMKLIALEELEIADQELLSTKTTRSKIEYYFTCTPALSHYLFNTYPDVELLTYLDADLSFFQDPAPLFQEIGSHSVAIIAHRFPEYLRHLEIHGIYNVGWISFRRDPDGLACLQSWREQCLEWCYDYVEGDRFADQKYLDAWPTRFNNVIVLQHKGANVAPWNMMNYSFRVELGAVWVDEHPLIFFHFHGLRRVTNWLYNLRFSSYNVCPSPVVISHLYDPYIKTIRAYMPLSFQQSGVSQIRYNPRGIAWLKQWKNNLMQQYLIIIGGRAIPSPSICINQRRFP